MADRLLEQLPLDLGQQALSIYLWRLIGFFFPVLFGVILFSVALLTTHAVAGNQWMRSALLAFAIMCLGIYAAYLSGRWIRGRLSRIPREVRIILAPLRRNLSAPGSSIGRDPFHTTSAASMRSVSRPGRC